MFRSRLLRREPQIHKKAGWLMVVPDEVAHQHVGDVVIDQRHSYINEYYSKE